MDSRTARVLFARHLGPEKGFGLDLARAMDDACSKVDARIPEYVGGQMAAHRQRCVRNARIASSDALTADQWVTLAEKLKRAPLIQDVQTGKGALLCAVEGGAMVVTTAVEGMAGYRAVSLPNGAVRTAR